MNKKHNPTISIFTNLLSEDYSETLKKYCKENKDNFQFVGYGTPVRWKEYKHSRNPNIKFKRSFTMTDEQYQLLTNNEIDEPYPNDTKHGDNYKISMHLPGDKLIHDILKSVLEKTEEIVLDMYGDTIFRQTEPWLTLAKTGDYMSLHCDGKFMENKRISTDFSSVYYINDDYEGGNFSMPMMGFNLKPLANSLIIWSNPYSEDMAHEVLPVLNGDRFVAQGFFSKSKDFTDIWPKRRQLINKVTST